MTGPERTPDTELAGLPSWLYPAGFWVAVVLLAVGVLFPDFAVLGVAWVGLVPVLAALWVLVTGWQRDRRHPQAAVSLPARDQNPHKCSSFTLEL